MNAVPGIGCAGLEAPLGRGGVEGSFDENSAMVDLWMDCPDGAGERAVTRLEAHPPPREGEI
jgi:hypothetical protein